MDETVSRGINAESPAGSAPERTVKPQRDARIDLVRGLALIVIFINHMPGNWLSAWTPRNFGFSDAAEIFVLLAGYAAAMAYGGLSALADRHALIGKAWRRAAMLYGAHLVTSFFAFMLFWAVIRGSAEPVDLDLIGVAPIIADPSTSLVALLIGGFQLSYFNILPLYVVLLLALPAMLWLAARDLRLLALASAAAWLATSLTGIVLPSMGEFDSWFFNPIAWQALFVIGLSLGLMHRRGQAIGYHPGLYGAALGYLAFAAWWRLAGSGGDLGEGILPSWLGSLQKSNLPLARLAHVAALAYVVGHSRAWVLLSRVPRDFAATRMGRNSLPVFMTGSLLSMAGWLANSKLHGGMAMETAIVVMGVSAMVVLAMWLEGALSASRGRRRLPMPAFAPVLAARQRRHSRMTR